MEFISSRAVMTNTSRNILVVCVSVLLLNACSTKISKQSKAVEPAPEMVDTNGKVVPKNEPKSKYGNPPSYVVFGKRYYTLPTVKGYVEEGIASWYGPKFHGKRTSSGETYDMYKITAAHKTLPIPCYARVTNKANGRSIIVRINDRGPFHDNRIIDLSYTAATQLGIVSRGTGYVEVRAIDPTTSAIAIEETKAAGLEQVAEQTQTDSKTNDELKIFVQVGAFGVQSNAQVLAQKMRSLDLGAVDVHQFSHAENVIHKVWIGPLDTVSQADAAVIKLNEIQHQDYKIVFSEALAP
jgi:rare lipoprotein A